MTTSVQNPADAVNAALVRIGHTWRVANLYDGSKGAKLALDIYGQTRDEELRINDYGFAQRDVVLTLLKTAPVGGYIPGFTTWNPAANPPPPWIYEYQYNGDFIKVRSLKSSYVQIPNFQLTPKTFNIANDNAFTPPQKVILCNVGNAIAVYTARITDPTTWETAFAEALIASLARRLSAALADMNQEKLEAQDEQVETGLAAMVQMSGDPATIVNRALDAVGSDLIIGEIEEGTGPAKVALRHWGPVIKQLLRTAHWNFARTEVPLQLLADATGQTPNVGTIVPSGWAYEYAVPIDMMKARFIPLNGVYNAGTPTGNISLPATPLTTATSTPPTYRRIVPARFQIANDYNYNTVTDQQQPWGQQTDWWDIQGVSPTSRTVILTNAASTPTCPAKLVYTSLVVYPSLWDSLFEEAVVAALAERFALPLAKDKRFGLQLRNEQIAVAKDKIKQARIRDGDEGTPSSDMSVDWIRVRSSGSGSSYGGSGFGGDGPGQLWGGFDAYGFTDGSSY